MIADISNIAFTADELDELDDLILSATPKKKLDGKGKGKGKEIVIEHRESPVPVGLILQVTEVICKCCGGRERLAQGVLIKYTYRGGFVKRPLSPTNELDQARMMNRKEGSREMEMGEKEIPHCAKCSALILNDWK